MKQQQMSLSSPADFCTVAWAAEHLGVSQRWVRELAKPGGPLQSTTPLHGSRETGRRHTLLWAEQVREYGRARAIVKGQTQ